VELNIQGNVKIGLGVSQGIGMASRGHGTRVVLITEALYCGGRERDIFRQSLERANLKALHLEFLEGDNPHDFAQTNKALIRGARTETVIVFGGNRLIHLTRWMLKTLDGIEQPQLVILPAVPGVPFLFRQDSFWGTGHPTDSQFFEWEPARTPLIFIDPYLNTNMSSKLSVAHLLQTLFFLYEAALHEHAGLFIRSLALGTARGLWNVLEQVFEQPTKGDSRAEGFEAGLAAAVCHHALPRLSGTTSVMILEGITYVPQGLTGAILLPGLLETMAPKVPHILKEIGSIMGKTDSEESAEALGQDLGRDVRRLMGKFGIPLRLRELDLVESEVGHAAELTREWKTPAGGAVGTDSLPVFLRSAF